MDLDTAENRARIINFGDLSNDLSFHIESPETGAYNCIAWAMGFTDRWVDYIYSPLQKKKWWPVGVERSFKPESLVKAFEAVGFVKCDDDAQEDGYDKVALYDIYPYYDPETKETKNEYGWTHAARVITTQKYHSKMGGSFDIFHRSGDVFAGTGYGEVFQFMKRKSEEARSIISKIVNSEPRLSISEREFEEVLALVKASGIVL